MKEEDTKEVELHNEDDDGVISPGTSYSNGIHTAEASTGNTEEEDSSTGESYNDDSNSSISSNMLYKEGLNTSGEDRNDTRQNNGTLLQDPVNYRDGTIASDTACSIRMSGEDTYDSDEDTGYESDDQGTHNLEAKSANKTTSRTTSPKIMEQSQLYQEGCEDNQQCLEE